MLLRLLARRALHAVGVVWLVASLTFVLLHLAPGDPIAAALDNPFITAAVRAHWRAQLGLDRPWPVQYVRYLAGVAHGDLGYSLSQHEPVRDVLIRAVPNTLQLMAVALLASFLVGVAVGVVQARRRGTMIDRALTAASLVLYSMPDFWLALMVLVLFTYRLPLFPVTGMVDPVMHAYLGFWGRFGDRASHFVLPAGTLALITSAAIARYQRAAMLETGEQEFVRTARAKGVGEGRIVRHHILRNALLPVVTLLGLTFPALVGGAVFVEKIFAWPGMGYVTVNAIGTRDAPLLTASVIVGSLAVMGGNLLADLLAMVIDPRVRPA